MIVLSNNLADVLRASELEFSSTQLTKYLLSQLLHVRYCSSYRDDKTKLCHSLFPQRVSNENKKQKNI